MTHSWAALASALQRIMPHGQLPTKGAGIALMSPSAHHCCRHKLLEEMPPFMVGGETTGEPALRPPAATHAPALPAA